MTTHRLKRLCAAALAAALALNMQAFAAAAQPAAGTRILEVGDHAEIGVDISASGVVRVALLGDRIARVIGPPQAKFDLEHDPAAGDLYLRPVAETSLVERGAPSGAEAPREDAGPPASAALFIGSEKGSTYRLTLTPVAGGAAQILLRAVDDKPQNATPPDPHTGRVAGIAELIRVVAGGVPPAGYTVEPADGAFPVHDGLVPLEVWRGPRHEALVLALKAGAPANAPALAARMGRGVAAVWIGFGMAGTATQGQNAGRLAVVVRETPGR